MKPENLAPLAPASAKFERWLKEKDLVDTQVSGQGLNCFIYSLLQHVTGLYNLMSFDESLVRMVKKIAGLDPVSM